MFSYTDPSASTKDAIRFLIGDTDSTEAFLQDEEIAFLVSKWERKSGGSPYLIAAYACEAIASKLAREVSVSADGQSLSLDGLMDKYQRLAGQLRQQHKDLFVGDSGIYIGGLDPHEQPDPSVRPLAFGTGMHDNYEAGNQDYGDGYAGDEHGQWGEFNPT